MTALDPLWWCSWEQLGDNCRPIAWPPPAPVIAFWESGIADEFVTVVALIRARSDREAMMLIKAEWSPGIIAWRFCREYDDAKSPGDRFPAPKWSVARGSWPWTLPATEAAQ